MKQSVFDGFPQVLEQQRYAHGGNLTKMAEQAGCAADEILDFSASMNPLGPPEWLGSEVGRALNEVTHYPDPDCTDLIMAACEAYKVWPAQVLPGNGASELLQAVVGLGGYRRAVIPSPTYVDYERLCALHRLETEHLPLKLENGFQVDFVKLGSMLTTPSLVFLCQPNNPTGQAFDPADLREVAAMFPQSRFIVDESYAEFMQGHPDRLVKDRPSNVITIISLTKFFSIPGLRLGLAFADPETILRMKNRLPAWSVNAMAQRVGARALRDTDYAERTREQTRLLRNSLASALRELPGIQVFPSNANFLLCKMDRLGMDALPLYEKLLKDKVAIRLCGNFEGLDNQWFRIAVRGEDDNDRLVRALRRATGVSRGPVVKRNRRTPAIMLQGTCSNAGKSVLAAALCRILLQDGFRVAPFKAQNMSLNSYVTADGAEMGRAQVTQAAACRLGPDVRMNPVLLKPGSDVGSQVIVMGRPVGNMSVREYVQFKPRAWEAVKTAYDSLANEHEVMVLEGAGSPAEINLKHHDIVNMAMARHADASVILAGDIDRGGVFASLVGTMNLLTPAERKRVLGFAINRFRGEASLLDPALSFTFQNTGKPVLGVVPYIHNLGLPEEDSVSFKDGFRPDEKDKLPPDQCVDIAVIDLPRISNFNDIDPLYAEPDVHVRIVDSALELGTPDAVIIPGSKSTVPDMKALKGMGMAAAIRSLAQNGTTRIIGICGGFQMLGERVDDPFGLESDCIRQEGFGLLPVQTELTQDKTLKRTVGVHCKSSMRVHGYEIHHGETRPLSSELRVALRDREDQPLGFGLPDGRVWGTYLHGLFDSDDFRRWFVDQLRMDKGLEPLEHVQTTFNIEAGLDHLASVVRESLDMDQIYNALGYGPCCRQAPLIYKL